MSRIWFVFGFLILFFTIVITRLFYWQIIEGDRLSKEASLQHFIELTIPASRGQIITSDGAKLVMNQSASLVYGEPKHITNIASFSTLIAPILDIPSASITAQLSDPTRVWIPLAHKVNEERVNELKKLSLTGLGYEKESKRFYPEASMAAHLVGFVGSNAQGGDTGYFGLEGLYDRELSGKSGYLRIEKDVLGAPILVSEATRIDPENGRNLVLWMDRSVQRIVERRLLEGIQKYGAKEGSVVVMDPKTGGILAMASYPTYDPTHFSDFDHSLFKNPVIASSYEPGSTFKTLVMSAAIEEHGIKSDSVVDETGPVRIGDYSIRTWNDTYHGPITMAQVLEYSSNVGMVYIEKKLGGEKLLKYIRAFGFGELSGIDLQEESSPELRSDNEWGEIDFATASFGQGIAVTPIQMVRGVAAIANDGWIMEPHVVKEIVDVSGRTVPIRPKQMRRVISVATANVMTEMMVDAVDKGEAKWAKPKGYRIAGKTGTAQVPVAGHYEKDKTIASFVGFAPADNPRFVMLVTLLEPTSSPWGSETAAPLFFKIAQDVFTYYGISPQ